MSGRPLDVLEDALHESVTVRLKDGETFTGVLGGYDQHLNLVLDAPEEEQPDAEAVEDTTVIRGDNVVTIQT